MNKFVSGLLLALCLAGQQCGAAEPSDNPERQVLVMLHLPAPHFRPDANYGGRYADDAGRQARHRIAEQLADAHGLRLVADWPMPTLGVDCFVMQPVPDKPELPADKILAGLMQDARVEWAQQMGVFHPLDRADSLYAVQPSAKFWHLAELHRVASGRGVTVAVVDSGVEDTHPDLSGQLAYKENFVDANPYAAELHGTAVAGIIAARAGNGAGIVGIAPDARLMALRGCWQEPDQSSRCSTFTLGKALNFAILNGANVINLSLGGPPDRLLQRLLDQALARGITVVGAANPSQSGGGFPASHPGVIAVAELASVPRGALLAPGRDIPTAAPGARWRFVSGTSYAAAHVTGLAALVAELLPGAGPEQIRRSIRVERAENSLVKSTWEVQAAPLTSAGGAIDACATISHLAAACTCSCGTTKDLKASN